MSQPEDFPKYLKFTIGGLTLIGIISSIFVVFFIYLEYAFSGLFSGDNTFPFLSALLTIPIPIAYFLVAFNIKKQNPIIWIFSLIMSLIPAIGGVYLIILGRTPDIILAIIAVLFGLMISTPLFGTKARSYYFSK
jgi:hypothetical protein